jgi:hypothetical protein
MLAPLLSSQNILGYAAVKTESFKHNTGTETADTPSEPSGIGVALYINPC